MRHNNRHKASKTLNRYDRVYIHVPQCPWLRSMVAEPIKTIFYNSAAEESANIDRLFKSVWDLEDFVIRYGIELG